MEEEEKTLEEIKRQRRIVEIEKINSWKEHAIENVK